MTVAESVACAPLASTTCRSTTIGWPKYAPVSSAGLKISQVPVSANIRP